MYQRKEERSLGELFSELGNEISALFRQEVEIARTEMTDKASQAGKGAAMVAVGGFVAYAGFLAILAALVSGLAAAGMPVWASALLVGLVVAGIGYLVIRRGLDSFKAEKLAPYQTIQSIRENGEWAKKMTRNG